MKTLEKTLFWTGCDCNPEGMVYYDAPEVITEGGFTCEENKLQVYPEWMMERENERDNC